MQRTCFAELFIFVFGQITLFGTALIKTLLTAVECQRNDEQNQLQTISKQQELQQTNKTG